MGVGVGVGAGAGVHPVSSVLATIIAEIAATAIDRDTVLERITSLTPSGPDLRILRAATPLAAARPSIRPLSSKRSYGILYPTFNPVP